MLHHGHLVAASPTLDPRLLREVFDVDGDYVPDAAIGRPRPLIRPAAAPVAAAGVNGALLGTSPARRAALR